ncbi:MAG TPA: hypothetical protein VIF62_11185 [Labilithrix sp.]
MRKATLALLFFLAACRREPAITAEPEPPPERPAWEPLARPRAATATMVLETYKAPPDTCEPGQSVACFAPGRGRSLSGADGPYMECVLMADGAHHFTRETCNTPLVFAFDERPVAFTDAPGEFAIGLSRRTQWVSSATPWLVLDDDASGCVESERELFGVARGAANGFDDLARLDENGDGRLDAHDAAFAKLALWYDRDQDRTCAPSEIVPLADAGVIAIDLAHTPRGPSQGASFEGERGTFELRDGTRGRVVDVYLAPR